MLVGTSTPRGRQFSNQGCNCFNFSVFELVLKLLLFLKYNLYDRFMGFMRLAHPKLSKRSCISLTSHKKKLAADDVRLIDEIKVQ